jgi:hypothetical protein
VPDTVKITAPDKAPDFTNPYAPRPGETIEVAPNVAAVLVAEGLAIIVDDKPAKLADSTKVGK